ncbi:hypothetical protein DL93DRAFT_208002 [Clavulina sp. PMI_390]|nr:hypothetical protein DL93DRAFT_208002 [Clavulina sp. PMI_390]
MTVDSGGIASIPLSPRNLPIELQSQITAYLDHPSLIATSSASWVLHLECERYLYTNVKISNERQIESFLYSLRQDPDRAKRVLSCMILDFDVHQHTLVHSMLKAMSKLRSLVILPNIPEMDFNAGWDALLTGCDFQLLEFVTSFDCDRALTNFLITQTGIEKYIHSGYTPTQNTNIFHDPSVLPSLKHFHGNIIDLSIIIPHRPVTHVTVQDGIAAMGLQYVLHPLGSSKGPIEHLSLSFVDPVTSASLSLIQQHTPRLQTLELAAPSARSARSELDWAEGLASFKHLTRLSYEKTATSLAGEVRPLSPAFQKELVAAWSEACPSLRTVEFTVEVVQDADDTIDEILRDVECWTLDTKQRWTYGKVERAAGQAW